jgi:predicted DNA-binding transcriptional regulator AlpA
MNKIREIAKIKNIRISRIIKTTGISKSFIYDVINEKSQPTIPIGYKIADSLSSALYDVFPHD